MISGLFSKSGTHLVKTEGRHSTWMGRVHLRKTDVCDTDAISVVTARFDRRELGTSTTPSYCDESNNLVLRFGG